MDIDLVLREPGNKILELPHQPDNQRHIIFGDGNTMLKLLHLAREQGCFLRSMFATDERLREGRCFKIYYLLSDDQNGQLMIFETDIGHSEDVTYPSGRAIFPAVKAMEEQIYDLFGLKADAGLEDAENGYLLHSPAYSFEEALLPLRRTRTEGRLKQIIQSGQKQRVSPALRWDNMFAKRSISLLSVGPVHAGIIESGQFLFYLAGEVIEDLSLRLGYKHRGVEKLFETHHTLETGWKLAEKVSGDSSFAHSLAYCQAVEDIAQITPPETALWWRALLLELERVYNHIADVSALAQDMAYDRAAAKIASLRETLVELNQRVSGNRFLRGVNLPGGINLSIMEVNTLDIITIVQAVSEEFLEWAKNVMENPKCRERMLGVGTLPPNEATRATGLAARASGLLHHDWRLQHPRGVYDDPETQKILLSTIVPDGEENPTRQIPIYRHDLKGDVFARLALRVAEVETSAKLIFHFAERLQAFDLTRSAHISITDHLLKQPGLNFGVGIVEGWRGDIVYTVFKGQEDTIFRCNPRDPSIINWQIFPATVRGNRLADFPLINKSFNLSYAGFDL
ncbi:MAG: NADH-quinone oxidoreductase subunit C [Chloroflexota bacterium]